MFTLQNASSVTAEEPHRSRLHKPHLSDRAPSAQDQGQVRLRQDAVQKVQLSLEASLGAGLARWGPQRGLRETKLEGTPELRAASGAARGHSRPAAPCVAPDRRPRSRTPQLAAPLPETADR